MSHISPSSDATLRLSKVATTEETPQAAFDRLLNVMEDLRALCPWDKKQTIESLRYLTIEETYELSDAILSSDMEEIKKELGDMMLHLIFYSKIASETNAFDITDVPNGICGKLIRRHPHIYADVNAEDEEAVKANWEKIKLQEKGSNPEKPKRLLDGVPASMPALVKAVRIQEKARGVGFDWNQASEVWDKVKEEEQELFEHIDNHTPLDKEKVEDEFGDLLFALVNYARFLGINPEDALERTNRKFIKRFEYIEDEGRKDGKNLASMTLEQMTVYWQKAKQQS